MQPDAKLVAEEEKPTHLLDLLRRKLLGKQRTARTGNDGSFLYGNVKALMATGIRFRRSKTGELRDVSFTSHGMIGYLNLPLLAIDRSSVPRLWNLMAYEVCPNMTTDSGVTSYVSFLDSLLDNSEDVKALESTRVLQNFFGGNEEVAQFFNSISVNLAVRDFSAYYYATADIRAHVRRHNSNRTYIWMIQLLDTYFTSPWTITVLVAAILVLFLTDVQTYFSLPSFHLLIVVSPSQLKPSFLSKLTVMRLTGPCKLDLLVAAQP